MEVLAPVGNLTNLKIAVNSGADAIYLGASAFNARAKCDEINLNNLKEVVDFCHLYNVKVYLTVNTLIKQSEVTSLYEFLKKAYASNVDAFIIQDMAVYYAVRHLGLDIELHASTQMGIHNLSGAKVAEKLGFSRVVLSRETSLEDIEKIHKNTNLEIEYFVQGALCISFSGNCYLSSLKNNKSGNRGECLQLCRTLQSCNNSNKYFLSARDLCLVDKIEQLKNVGVCSLKIEGRMRREAYVAQSVLSYKNAVNKTLNNEKDKLQKVFSRGSFLESGYLFNEKNVVDTLNNGHTGVLVGSVVKTSKFKDIYKVFVKTNHTFAKGDGVKFVSESVVSMGVGNVEKQDDMQVLFTSRKVEDGSKVYLTVDSEYEKRICEIKRKLEVNIEITAIANQKFCAKMQCGNSKIEIVFDDVATSQNSPITSDDIFKCFNKTGDTNFALKNFSCETLNAFIAKSVLNEYRRKCYETLEKQIVDDYKIKRQNQYCFKDKSDFAEKMPKYPSKFENNANKYIIFDKLTQISVVDNNKIYIYAPQNYDAIIALDKFAKTKVYLALPFFATQTEVEKLKKIMTENNFAGVYSNNIYGLDFGNTNIMMSYMHNITSTLCLAVCELLEVDDICLSVENNLVEINGKKYSGNVALMNFVHCPQKTIYNQKCKADCVMKNLSYSGYKIRRIKNTNCYFELVDKDISNAFSNEILDIRN